MLIKKSSCPSLASTHISIVSDGGTLYLANRNCFHASTALIAGASSAWSILSLPRFIIASHCPVRRLFVGLVNRNATMRSSPTLLSQQGSKAETWPCAVNLEAHLAFPAEHSASRVLGKAVMAEMARLVGEGMRRREARKASHMLCCSDGSERGVIGG